jgi:hypothetical protein
MSEQKVSGNALIAEIRAMRESIDNNTKMLARMLAFMQSGVNTAKPPPVQQKPVVQQQQQQRPTIGNPMPGANQGPMYPSMTGGNQQPSGSGLMQANPNNFEAPGISGIEEPLWLNEPTATNINPTPGS